MRLTRLLPLFVVLLLVSCFSAQAQQPPPLSRGGEQTVRIQSVRPASSVALASGALRSAVERLQRGQTAGLGIGVVDSKIRVEVLHTLESAEIRSLITDLGGTVEGEVEGVLVQALVPFDRLVALESHDGVQFVRPPLEANVPTLPPSGEAAAPQNASPIVGEEVAKTNADEWHAAGYTGAGVKVGIIDGFDGTLWNNAAAAGELPTPAGTFGECEGSTYDIWTSEAEHGQAVAEVIHEMAPDAQLYLATACTVSDHQAAVDYFDTQGVNIISRSLTSEYDGPGDGTGPIAAVIDNAVADGMVWFNSAGNAADDGSFVGQYWRGPWVDDNVNGWIEFATGDELLGFSCEFTNGVRWSDFGAANPTDYDVCVFDNPDDSTPIACSVDDQTAGAPPLELDIPCTGDVDYLAIYLYDAGGGTSGDILEFMTNNGAVEHWQNRYSASGPASDTASPGGLSVGAVDPPLGTAIAPYSSQGPTNDELYGGMERKKPDISAAAGVASYTYGTFSGTSASTPATAGAAALIIEAGLASTPAQVKTYLLNNATVDRGTPGPDNVFGKGELFLGSPPSPDSDGASPISSVAVGTDVYGFGRDAGNSYWNRHWNGTSWEDWSGLGGVLSTSPSAVAAGGDVYVFGLDAGGGVWYRRHSGGTWGGWQALGGILSGQVSGAATADNDVYVFGRDAGGGYWNRHWNGTSWEAWSGLGGILSSSPSAVAAGGDVYVFGLDAGGGVWYQRHSGGSWGGWQALGGILSGQVSGAATASNDLYVFGRDAGGGYWYRHWNGTSWEDWSGLGGILSSSPSAVAAGTDVYVSGLDAGGGLWYRRFSGGSWGGWQALGGVLTGKPSPAGLGSGDVYVFGLGGDSGLWYRHWSGTSWQDWSGLGGILAP